MVTQRKGSQLLDNLADKLLNLIFEIGPPVLRTMFYVLLAFLVVAVAIQVGPFTFEYFDFNVTGSRELTYSEATNYFLQALLAIAIGLIPSKK